MTRLRITLLVVGFLAFRAALFAVTTASEYSLYWDYGEAARHTSLAELSRTRDVESPQLAVLFGSLAGVVADALPTGIGWLRGLRPEEGRGEGLERYEVALGLVLFALGVSCLGLVSFTARRVPRDDSTPRRAGRLALYVAFSGAQGLI